MLLDEAVLPAFAAGGDVALLALRIVPVAP